ncbi:MAG: Holliday junction DNA helicase RuvA [Candidatus Omnitrophica bacterium]|nr:Holliday junction DNA helicase RuvA [Candidatus Omnitrophota bacterium]
MIVRLHGVLVDKQEHSVVLNVSGVFYEVLVPQAIVNRVAEAVDPDGKITMVTYHYYVLTPSSATPMLIGFLSEVERDFFLDFISVSGIGPRAAVKALNKPISQIAQAIHAGDVTFLKTLPGIGLQRAKEVVAKLQNKTGRFALIQDKTVKAPAENITQGFEQEALEVLLQLQYKRHEAASMIQKAMERSKDITSVEDLLNEIYKQRIKT